MEDVIERLRKFVLAHPEMSKSGFIKGLDKEGKVVIIVNGQEKRITIDELENGHLNQNNTVQEQPEEIEVMDEVPSQSNESIETLSTDIPSNNQMMTLKDFKDAVVAKDEVNVNKALETFALDNTGIINMDKAIKVVTDNCTNNVISSIRDNVVMPSDLSKYDVSSKIISPLEKSEVKEDLFSLIDKSFNNILIYVEAARLKNIVYNDLQIQAAKKKYATSIQDKINVLGLNKQKDEIKPDNVKVQPKAMNLKIQPDKNLKKAGFADVLILTVIVLVYAAIIINLITKLK